MGLWIKFHSLLYSFIFKYVRFSLFNELNFKAFLLTNNVIIWCIRQCRSWFLIRPVNGLNLLLLLHAQLLWELLWELLLERSRVKRDHRLLHVVFLLYRRKSNSPAAFSTGQSFSGTASWVFFTRLAYLALFQVFDAVLSGTSAGVLHYDLDFVPELVVWVDNLLVFVLDDAELLLLGFGY